MKPTQNRTTSACEAFLPSRANAGLSLYFRVSQAIGVQVLSTAHVWKRQPGRANIPVGAGRPAGSCPAGVSKSSQTCWACEVSALQVSEKPGLPLRANKCEVQLWAPPSHIHLL